MSKYVILPCQSDIKDPHNVAKIQVAGETKFAEVKYYFKLAMQENRPQHGFAMVSLYSPPDAGLLESSFNTVWSCRPGAENALTIIDVTSIQSVVAMVPHPRPPATRGDLTNLVGSVFVMEKLGLDTMSTMAGVQEDPHQDS